MVVNHFVEEIFANKFRGHLWMALIKKLWLSMINTIRACGFKSDIWWWSWRIFEYNFFRKHSLEFFEIFSFCLKLINLWIMILFCWRDRAINHIKCLTFYSNGNKRVPLWCDYKVISIYRPFLPSADLTFFAQTLGWK